MRCLYVQEDIADDFVTMLKGAMNDLALGDPWQLSTDIGPVIDDEARANIHAHIETARAEGRLLHETRTPNSGHYIAPSLIRLDGIHQMTREIFGPVLHVVRFANSQIDAVIDAVNATGYGLTFGLMTRIDDRVQHVAERVEAGNIYVNRNQIGAVVGSQPFGGEGMSGTGPKAGGPLYLSRFRAPAPPSAAPETADWETPMPDDVAQSLIDAAPAAERGEERTLPGPTGELNRYSLWQRPPLLCLGPGRDLAARQAGAVRALGGLAVEASGALDPEALTRLTGIGGVLYWGDTNTARAYETALARRSGPILPLITAAPDRARAWGERHLCVDTTAAGGNAALLGGMG